MNEHKRYNVFSLAPKQIKLEDYGLKADGRNDSPYPRTIVEGRFSQAEYHSVFGETANIIHGMFVETHDDNNYTIRIFAGDVLAIENSAKSHQGELINQLLKMDGRDILDREQMEATARGYEDITPQALEVLLNAAENHPDPFSMNMNLVTYAMRMGNLTIADFVRA